MELEVMLITVGTPATAAMPTTPGTSEAARSQETLESPVIEGTSTAVGSMATEEDLTTLQELQRR
jgi:hypothetical protein